MVAPYGVATPHSPASGAGLSVEGDRGSRQSPQSLRAWRPVAAEMVTELGLEQRSLARMAAESAPLQVSIGPAVGTQAVSDTAMTTSTVRSFSKVIFPGNKRRNWMRGQPPGLGGGWVYVVPRRKAQFPISRIASVLPRVNLQRSKGV
jgi:hypothetical protein